MSRLKSLSYFLFDISHLLNINYDNNQKPLRIVVDANNLHSNIVECKYESNVFFIKQKFELIETLWNVNTNSVSLRALSIFELIDTLWNVNEDKEWYLEMQNMELIDTCIY